MDNLASAITSVHAIIKTSKNLENATGIDVVSVFDNEEIGSRSYQGCDSSFFGTTIKRLFNTIEDFGERTSKLLIKVKGILLSFALEEAL